MPITQWLEQMFHSRVVEIVLDSFTKILLPGLRMTIPLTVLSFAIGLAVAVLVALVQFALVPLARFYIWFVRGTPLLVQLFVIFYGLPKLGLVVPAFEAAVAAFSLNEGAYMAESIRAALEAVPSGQLEAAGCVGLSYPQAMRRVVLPQALRTAFPSLVNSLIALLKDTSLAANITVAEMVMAANRIVARTYEPLAIYLELAVIYLLFCTVITKLQKLGERRLGSYARQGG